MTMVAAAAVGTGPRYAPHDPTLPHPWRALVDGNTGYLYYWNPETNVTQYEKPLPQTQAPPPLPPGPPPSVTPAETQPQPQPQPQAQPQPQPQPQPHHHHHQQQQQQHQQHNQQQQHPAGNSDVTTNGVLMPSHHKLAAIPILRNQDQGMGGMHPSHMPVGVANGSAITATPGPGQMNGSFKYGPSGPNYGGPPVKQSPGMHMANQPPSSGTVDAYRMEHEVTATGDNVPAPFMTFDQAGLPPEMLREVRYLLQKGAYVVRCTAVQQKHGSLLSCGSFILLGPVWLGLAVTGRGQGCQFIGSAIYLERPMHMLLVAVTSCYACWNTSCSYCFTDLFSLS